MSCPPPPTDSSRPLPATGDLTGLLGGLRIGDVITPRGPHGSSPESTPVTDSPHTIISIASTGTLTLWLAGLHGQVRVDVYPLHSALLDAPASQRPASQRPASQRPAAKTHALGLSYRGIAALPPATGEGLCAAIAARIAPVEQAVLAGLQHNQGSRRIREISGGPLLTPMGHGHEALYGLAPYVGCLIGCSFCYAQGRAQAWRQLLGLRDAAWGSWTDVRTDAAETLRRELRTLPPLPIKLSPIVTDPYQPMERQRRITRQCLQVLASEPHEMPVIVLTRSDAVLDDIDLLARIPRLWVGMTVPTIDDTVRRQLEPGAAPISSRIDVLAKLGGAGVRTFGVVQPMLPGDPHELAAALATVVTSVTADTLSGTYGAAELFRTPELAHACDPAWQQRHLRRVVDALRQRGVHVWQGELPPGV